MRSSAALLLAVRVAFVALVAPGCAHAPPGPALGERFSLRAGQSVRIAGTTITITFDRILADSRCAIDVVCIHAGSARGAFRMGERGKSEESFELETDRDRSRMVGGYRVDLFAVLPAPRSTVEINPRDYTVEITVSQ